MAAICDALLLRWEKERSSPVGRFPHSWDGICLQQTHTHTHTHKDTHTHTPFTALHGISLPAVLWGSQLGKGIRLMWQPLPACTALPGTPLRSQESKWHVQMRTRRWKTWSQRPLVCTWCDISRHPWVMDRLSDADVSSSPSPNLLFFSFLTLFRALEHPLVSQIL